MTSSQQPVTRADIEAKIDEIVDDLEQPARSAIETARLVGVGVVVAVVVIAYLFGRRAGRSKSAIVELRRL
jgi:enamine deaminase RidA (YjgF/YER057c/UK114 family)